MADFSYVQKLHEERSANSCEPLFFKSYDHGKNLVFHVVGQFCEKQRPLFLRYEPKPASHRFVSKDEKAKMLTHLVNHNIVSRCGKPEIAEMIRNGHMGELESNLFGCSWIVPLDLGGAEEMKNVHLVHNFARYEMLHRIWVPLKQQMDAAMATGKYQTITMQLPQFPRFLDLEAWDKFIASNQGECRRTEHRKEILKSQTYFDIEEKGQAVIVRMKSHPFVCCPVWTVQLDDPEPNARQEFNDDLKLKTKVCRRDASLLKKLSAKERGIMFRMGQYPKRLHFEYHHILPLEFGGKNTLTNLCLVAPEVHLRFNKAIELPLKNFLRENPHLKARKFKDKDIYFELPIPLTAYVSPTVDLGHVTKLKKVKSLKYNRRKIRHQEAQTLLMQQRLNDFDYERA